MQEHNTEWISVRDAAALLCADVETVRGYIKRGVLAATYIGERRGRLHVRRADVEQALRRQPGEPSAGQREQVRSFGERI